MHMQKGAKRVDADVRAQTSDTRHPEKQAQNVPSNGANEHHHERDTARDAPGCADGAFKASPAATEVITPQNCVHADTRKRIAKLREKYLTGGQQVPPAKDSLLPHSYTENKLKGISVHDKKDLEGVRQMHRSTRLFLRIVQNEARDAQDLFGEKYALWTEFLQIFADEVGHIVDDHEKQQEIQNTIVEEKECEANLQLSGQCAALERIYTQCEEQVTQPLQLQKELPTTREFKDVLRRVKGACTSGRTLKITPQQEEFLQESATSIVRNQNELSAQKMRQQFQAYSAISEQENCISEIEDRVARLQEQLYATYAQADMDAAQNFDEMDFVIKFNQKLQIAKEEAQD